MLPYFTFRTIQLCCQHPFTHNYSCYFKAMPMSLQKAKFGQVPVSIPCPFKSSIYDPNETLKSLSIEF